MSAGHSKKRKLARQNESDEIKAVRRAIKDGRVARTTMVKGPDGKYTPKCSIAQAKEELARYESMIKK